MRPLTVVIKNINYIPSFSRSTTLSGMRKIFRLELNIWKKWCKVKYVKSVIMGRSRYERYKNIKLNKRQRSNERVSQDKESPERYIDSL